MNRITFPLKLRMRRQSVADLQDGLRLLLARGVILANDEGARQELASAIQRERTRLFFGRMTAKAVSIFQEERQLEVIGAVGRVAGPLAIDESSYRLVTATNN